MKNTRSLEAEMRASYLDYAMSVIRRNTVTSFENNATRAAQGYQAMMAISNDIPESGGGVTDGPDVAATDDDDGGDSDGEPARRPRKELKNRTLKACAKSRMPLQSLTSDDAGNNMTNSISGKNRNVTATAGALPTPQNPDIALWRLPTVLAHIPVSRSGWWQGVKTGRYPAPVKLSTRCVAWRSADIRALIASF